MLNVLDGASPLLEAALAAGRLDLALVRPPLQQDGIRLQSIATEGINAVLRIDHPLAQAHTLQLAQLATDPLVMVLATAAPSVHDRLMAACADAGLSPLRVDHAVTSVSVLLMVAAGRGVGLLPASAIPHPHRDDVVSIPVRSRCRVPLALAWWKDKKPPVNLESVLAAVRTAAGAAGMEPAEDDLLDASV